MHRILGSVSWEDGASPVHSYEGRAALGQKRGLLLLCTVAVLGALLSH
ncbi:MAG: hypothetical protein M3Q12_01050 [Pseudomonadota bacterium]|nr:hypothetical protein [Polaromonas sp.]MBA3593927.1 hypothetical protein [Polaromonas sp.]MDQ3270743.1 hypothetical protein [Pseudomonadota bacterium]